MYGLRFMHIFERLGLSQTQALQSFQLTWLEVVWDHACNLHPSVRAAGMYHSG